MFKKISRFVVIGFPVLGDFDLKMILCYRFDAPNLVQWSALFTLCGTKKTKLFS